jgi:hypothetical protein
MIDSWWTAAHGPQLAQGDLLPDCHLPVFTGTGADKTEIKEEVLKKALLIVVTQSCDLENNKAEFVALCLVHTLSEFEQANPRFANRGMWENVRKGRVEGLHLLAGPDDPNDNQGAFVVDFGHIVSLPLEYLSIHADGLVQRWRLNSPYLEHFSQAFARFFMRVGLPSAIPPYR